ncbi:hypothetical protein Tsubulata_034314 [Turnera subulata]|uniref:Uncharacterized protein n=1 Tax=Turnera subulata TaxID=218843 RepID=A0A9Q0J9E2_9ROSI|nr:hypothetical protein Tsubulata_034314 [Turnera subulata]
MPTSNGASAFELSKGPATQQEEMTVSFAVLNLGGLCYPFGELLLSVSGSRLRTYGAVKSTPVPPTLVAPEKEAAKAVLKNFLIEKGFTNAVATRTINKSRKLRALSGETEIGTDGQLPPHILYLFDLGMDLDQIKQIIARYPYFAYLSLDRQIRPMAEFLLSLGLSKSDIMTVFIRTPQICALGMKEDITPAMMLLENLGMDKRRWPTVINKYPQIVMCSRQKVDAILDFFYEMGLSAEGIVKVLTWFPSIVGYSLERNLRPTAKYFRSLGVRADVILTRWPQAFGLSIEGNLKPSVEFFLEKGYSQEEVGTMISLFGCLVTYSLSKNLRPKWEFFLTMNYRREDLIRFPHYFSYSLEHRIKPRYAAVVAAGVEFSLSRMLILRGDNFNTALKKKQMETQGIRSRKLIALSGETEIGTDGQLPPHILYLFDLGMDLDQIKQIIARYPYFAYLSLDRQIRPMAEFLLSLGLSKSDIMTVFIRTPQICALGMKEDITPAMMLLENLGMDKRRWPTVINKYPLIVTCSRRKLATILDFFYEMGLSAEGIVKVLTWFPNIVGYSLEKNLRPTAEYFRSLGVRADAILLQKPQAFGLSVEGNLKPSVEFFLEKGYSKEEVGTMISLFGGLVTYSLSKTLRPKWEFFLTMNYRREDLIRFPHYFSYSLEHRIKPRYAAVVAAGVEFPLSRMLALRGDNFDKALKKRQGIRSLCVLLGLEKEAKKQHERFMRNSLLRARISSQKSCSHFVKQGLSKAVAARTINKSDIFIDHLVSRLHSIHKTRYLVGRELTTLEIRDALIPYLESLHKEHGSILMDLLENYPDQSPIEKPAASVSPLDSSVNERKLKAVSRVSENGATGQLPPHILYLQKELGMSLDQIKAITRRFPAFAYYSLEGKIKPTVEFLLDLGISKSDIPSILSRRPQLCGISLAENIIPTMMFLENLGVDNTKWAKVIYRFPALLTYSRQKLETTINFFHEIGLSEENIGKVLTRCPNIISYSVEDKLRPTAEYFRSLGVDVAILLYRFPTTFGLSVDANLKPVTEFFLERGYSEEDVRTMVSRYGALYTFSLAENLMPKWEFFLTMDYPKQELVKFPQYFGYNLNGRIKPRYRIVKESGVKLLLNQVLSLTSQKFYIALEKKLKKMHSQQNSMVGETYKVADQYCFPVAFDTKAVSGTNGGKHGSDQKFSAST